MVGIAVHNQVPIQQAGLRAFAIGGGSVHSLDDLRRTREAEVAFHLAHRILEMLRLQMTSPDDEDDRQERPWLFPQVLAISKRWLRECVECVGGAFVQLLRLRELGDRAAEHIYNSILGATPGQKTLKAILRPYDKTGSTRYVDFDTTKVVWSTRENKCHVSHVVADTDSWEQKMAQVLEEMPEVYAYAKNEGMDFTIPYTLAGEQRQYRPDFLVRCDDGYGPQGFLNIIVEVSGEARDTGYGPPMVTRDHHERRRNPCRRRPCRERRALKGAESFLSELLAEGPLPSDSVKRKAAEAEISQRTFCNKECIRSSTTAANAPTCRWIADSKATFSRASCPRSE